MSAEHKRPLVAFLLVALACAFVVGQSIRTATLRQLVNAGLPLTALVPIAPDVLFSIELSSKHGRGGDDPALGRAIMAVASVRGTAGTVAVVSGGPGSTATFEPAPASGVESVVARTVRHAAAPAKHHTTHPATGSAGTPTLAGGQPGTVTTIVGTPSTSAPGANANDGKAHGRHHGDKGHHKGHHPGRSQATSDAVASLAGNGQGTRHAVTHPAKHAAKSHPAKHAAKGHHAKSHAKSHGKSHGKSHDAKRHQK